MIRSTLKPQILAPRLLDEAKMLVPLLVLVGLCLIPKLGKTDDAGKKRKDQHRYEFFPFSHFPMYSGFSERDYYVFVRDKNGDPVATESIAFVRSTKLKKIFNTDLSVIQKQYKKRKDLLTAEQCRPAGDVTLQQLVDLAPDRAVHQLREMSPLTLHRVYVSLEGGAIIETEPEAVGRWPAP